MALPTMITINGTYLKVDGSPETGTVIFRAPIFVLSGATSTVMVPSKIEATLDGAGHFSVSVPATNDPAWNPVGWTYKVTTNLSESVSNFFVEVPYNAPSASVTMSDLTPAAELKSGTAFTPASHTHSGYLSTGGGSMTGSLKFAGTSAGGFDTFDSTPRVEVDSWQTNGIHNYGEGIRLNLMRSMSKNMIAWRLPRPPSSSDLSTMKSVAWVGAHYHAQDQVDMNNPTDVHGHWSIEVPDAGDALRTRFEIKFVGPGGTIGVDKTLVQTSAADLVVDCSNGQVLRLRTGVGAGKFIEFGNDMWGAAPRWMVGSPGSTEPGSNVGSDFTIQRFNDAGVSAGNPVTITRSSGRVTLGGTDGSQSGLDVNRNSGGTAFKVNTNFAGATGAIAYEHNALEATSRTMQIKITTDANSRLVIFADGKHEWGDGTASRDANLYRASAGLLTTDQSFTVMQTFRHRGTSLGFYNATAVSKPTVSGAKGSNAALGSLLTALANLGLVTDSTTT